jgi:hypothetical protein
MPSIVETWEERLYYTKHNGIAQNSFINVLQRYREAKFISIQKSTPTPWTDAGVAFVCAVKYIISIKDSEGSMLVSAHASTAYAVWRINSKTKQILPNVFPTQPNPT